MKESQYEVHNWKCPGPEGLHNFWLKYLVAVHGPMVRIFNRIIQEPTKMSTFHSVGNTYLLFKNGDTTDPPNYMPLTCLSVMYKHTCGLSMLTLLRPTMATFFISSVSPEKFVKHKVYSNGWTRKGVTFISVFLIHMLIA